MCASVVAQGRRKRPPPETASSTAEALLPSQRACPRGAEAGAHSGAREARRQASKATAAGRVGPLHALPAQHQLHHLHASMVLPLTATCSPPAVLPGACSPSWRPPHNPPSPRPTHPPTHLVPPRRKVGGQRKQRRNVANEHCPRLHQQYCVVLRQPKGAQLEPVVRVGPARGGCRELPLGFDAGSKPSQAKAAPAGCCPLPQAAQHSTEGKTQGRREGGARGSVQGSFPPPHPRCSPAPPRSSGSSGST